MKHRKALFAIGVLGAAGIAYVAHAGRADAHHPELAVVARCDGTTIITASAWDYALPEHRVNLLVDVAVDGVVVGRGIFTPTNGYQFTITTHTATGAHLARVTAVDAWGVAGEYGYPGEYREEPFITPGVCRDIVIDTPTTTTTEAAPAPTTSTTVPDVTPAPPIVLTPRFAG